MNVENLFLIMFTVGNIVAIFTESLPLAIAMFGYSYLCINMGWLKND